MKKLLMCLILTGCTLEGGATLPHTYIGEPENFSCPVESFAYCEGNDPNEMECICIDRREQRRLFERIQNF